MEPQQRLVRMMELDYDDEDGGSEWKPIAQRAASDAVSIPQLTDPIVQAARPFYRPARDEDYRKEGEVNVPGETELNRRKALFAVPQPLDMSDADRKEALETLESIRRRRSRAVDDPMALFSSDQIQAERERERLLRSHPRYQFAESTAGLYGDGTSLDLFLNMGEVARRAQDAKAIQLAIAQSYTSKMEASEQLFRQMNAHRAQYEESTQLHTAVSTLYMPVIVTTENIKDVADAMTSANNLIDDSRDDAFNPWIFLKARLANATNENQIIPQLLSVLYQNDGIKDWNVVADFSTLNTTALVYAVQIIYCVDIFIADDGKGMDKASADILLLQWKSEMGWLFEFDRGVPSNFNASISVGRKNDSAGYLKDILDPILNVLADRIGATKVNDVLNRITSVMAQGYSSRPASSVPLVMSNQPRSDAVFLADMDGRGHATRASAFAVFSATAAVDKDWETLAMGTRKISFIPAAGAKRSNWEGTFPIRPPVASALIYNYNASVPGAIKLVPKNRIVTGPLLVPSSLGRWPDASDKVKEMGMESLRAALRDMESRVLRSSTPYQDVQLSFDVIRDKNVASFYAFIVGQFDLGVSYYRGSDGVSALDPKDVALFKGIARYIQLGVTVHDFAKAISDAGWTGVKYPFSNWIPVYTQSLDLMRRNMHLRLDARLGLLHLSLGYTLVREWILCVLDVCSARSLSDYNTASAAWNLASQNSKDMDRLREYYQRSYADSVAIAWSELLHPKSTGVIAYSIRFSSAINQAWDWVSGHLHAAYAVRLGEKGMGYILDSSDPKDERFRSFLAEVAARKFAQGDTVTPDVRYVPRHQLDAVDRLLENLRVRLIRRGCVAFEYISSIQEYVPRM